MFRAFCFGKAEGGRARIHLLEYRDAVAEPRQQTRVVPSGQTRLQRCPKIRDAMPPRPAWNETFEAYLGTVPIAAQAGRQDSTIAHHGYCPIRE